jgi:hypothetical protein
VMTSFFTGCMVTIFVICGEDYIQGFMSHQGNVAENQLGCRQRSDLSETCASCGGYPAQERFMSRSRDLPERVCLNLGAFMNSASRSVGAADVPVCILMLFVRFLNTAAEFTAAPSLSLKCPDRLLV